MGIDIQPPGPETLIGAGAASVNAHGVATGPAAAAALASIVVGSLQSGVRYQVTCIAFLNGTTASPADDDNIRVLFNGSTIMVVPVDGTAGNIGRVVQVSAVSAPSNGVNAIVAQAVGNATATAIYHVTLIATPLGD